MPVKNIPVNYSGTTFESIAAFCRFAEISRSTFDFFCNQKGVKIKPNDKVDELVEEYMKQPHKHRGGYLYAKPVLYNGNAYKSIVKLVAFLKGRGYKITAQDVYHYTSEHKLKNVYDYTEIIRDMLSGKKHAEDATPKSKEEEIDAFVMEHYEDMTYDEIAARFGVAKNVVGYSVNRLHKAGKLHYKHDRKKIEPLPSDSKVARDIAASVLRGVDFEKVDTQTVYGVRKSRVLKTVDGFHMPKQEEGFSKILNDLQFSILTDVIVRHNKLTKKDYYVIAENNKISIDYLLFELNQIFVLVGDEHFADDWEEYETFDSMKAETPAPKKEEEPTEKPKEQKLPLEEPEPKKEEEPKVEKKVDDVTAAESGFIKYYMLFGKERAARKYDMTPEAAFLHFCEMKDKYEIDIVLRER